MAAKALCGCSTEGGVRSRACLLATGWLGHMVRYAGTCRDALRWRRTILSWRSIQQAARGVASADCRHIRRGWCRGVEATLQGRFGSAGSDLAPRYAPGIVQPFARRVSARSTIWGPGMVARMAASEIMLIAWLMQERRWLPEDQECRMICLGTEVW